MDVTELKDRMRAEVERRRDTILEASHQIHQHPETNYEERFAHDLLAGILEGEGLDVTRRAHGVETAFAARAGTRGPTVAVLCEYDALPGIGHACGHNIIAAAGLGAGLAAAALAEEVEGRVLVLGTPAEEGGGGKIALIRAGALDGVDAALMVHPAGADLTRMTTIAVQEVFATYRGRAAHAAAAPHEGRNALDAAVIGYSAVGALRQHIRPSERVHGIVVEGGDKPNIVPARARTEWMVRSDTIASLALLKPRVEAALRSGAQATGCEVEIEWKDVVYADMLDSAPLVERWVENARGVGRTPVEPTAARQVVGSTDMGNVSYVVPSIHPMVQAAPEGTPIHTEDFERAAAAASGDQAAVDAATALAWTVADLWTDAGLREAVQQAHAATIEAVGAEAQRSAIWG